MTGHYDPSTIRVPVHIIIDRTMNNYSGITPGQFLLFCNEFFETKAYYLQYDISLEIASIGVGGRERKRNQDPKTLEGSKSGFLNIFVSDELPYGWNKPQTGGAAQISDNGTPLALIGIEQGGASYITHEIGHIFSTFQWTNIVVAIGIEFLLDSLLYNNPNSRDFYRSGAKSIADYSMHSNIGSGPKDYRIKPK